MLSARFREFRVPALAETREPSVAPGCIFAAMPDTAVPWYLGWYKRLQVAMLATGCARYDRAVEPLKRELLAPYTDRYFEVLADVWESRSHEMAQQIAVGLYPTVQVSGETLDKTDAWLTSAEPNAALRRLVSESRAGVERALRAQAADAAAS